MLFYKGDIKLLKNCNKNISITGNKNDYSEETVNYCAKKILKNKWIISTYLDSGVNELLLHYCFENSKKIICIIKNGIINAILNHKIVQNLIAQKSLILSEFYDDYYENDSDFSTFSLRILSVISENQLFLQNDDDIDNRKIFDYCINNANNAFLFETDFKKNKNLLKIYTQKGAIIIKDIEDMFKKI